MLRSANTFRFLSTSDEVNTITFSEMLGLGKRSTYCVIPPKHGGKTSLLLKWLDLILMEGEPLEDIPVGHEFPVIGSLRI